MLPLADYRRIRDTTARAFAESEVTLWQPIEQALAAQVAAFLKRYKAAKHHERKALEDDLKALGLEWRDASTRLNAAKETLERLGAQQ